MTQTQTDNLAAEPKSLTATARVAWVTLILATLYFCYFHNLGALGLVGPDEPRYAWIARDMAETSDWITPRLYGKPWFEKPPLYYWSAALSFKLFGISEVTARLPSALGALLATLALAWLAMRVYGAESARWFLLLLPTTVGMIGFSHAAATDMPFAAMLTVAMICAAVVLGLIKDGNTPILPRTPWLALLRFGFFLGLAALAKGPAAIVLSGGSVLLWGILTKRWRDAFRCLHPVAIIAFCATALPWYILCAHRNPDFLRVFIIEHNFQRYLTPEFQHIQPFWFYIPVFIVAIFPWIVLTVPTARSVYNQFRKRSSQSAFELLLFSWLAFVVLFFSLSHSKLPGYILPAVPPAVLLLSEQLCKLLEETGKQLRWIPMILGICLAIFGGIFVFASMRLPTYTDVRPSPLAEQIALIAVIGGIGIVLLGFFRHYRPALFVMVILLLISVARIDTFVGKVDPALTARSAFLEATKLWPGFTVSKASTWQLNRSLLYQLNFYSHTELPEWRAGQPRPKWLFAKPKQEAEARNLGFICKDYLISPAVILCRNPD